MVKVYYTKVNITIGNWRNIVVKGAEYNEGHPYKDLFQGGNYDNFLVELEDKQFPQMMKKYTTPILMR